MLPKYLSLQRINNNKEKTEIDSSAARESSNYLDKHSHLL